MNEHKPKPTKEIKKKLGIKSVKKPIIAGGIIGVIAIAGIIIGFIILTEIPDDEVGVEIILGVNNFLNSIDPLYNPDPNYVNGMVLDQVTEGLFAYNQNAKNSPIIPNLALDREWSPDGLNLTCSLRERVIFHDGTPFNATAVKWNFDRLYRFTKTMSIDDIWVWSYMYFLSDSRPIINETVVINENTIRFVLNMPYVPLLALLATWQSYILSPSSTPENDFIDTLTGELIGTGPFKLGFVEWDPYWEYSGKITIVANKNYWGGEPSISKAHILACFGDDRFQKILSGELTYAIGSDNRTRINAYKNATEVNLVETMGPSVFNIELDNNLFPLEMRKAMAYAFNYSNFIELYTENLDVRSKSPLPDGLLYSNWNLDVPVYDIQIARQTLKNASWPGTASLTANANVSAGNEWELLANSATPIATYNFSYTSTFYEHILLGDLLSTYFKQIGVKLEFLNLPSQEFYDKIRFGGMEFYHTGWGASFNDPVEILNPLYSINSYFNRINFNDTQVEDWLVAGLAEINDTERELIYYNIQKRLVEELYPVVWTYCPINMDVWASNVGGLPLEGFRFRFQLKDLYIK